MRMAGGGGSSDSRKEDEARSSPELPDQAWHPKYREPGDLGARHHMPA